MKMKSLILCSCLLSPSLSYAQFYNPADLTNSQGREVLCSALVKLESTDGKNVWPGFNPIASPLIVKFRDGIFGYGSSTSFADWTRETKGNCTSYSAPSNFKAPATPLVPYLDFNGTKAFFFDTTITSKLTSWLLSAIIHERFHRFQWENFPNLFPLLNSKYDGHFSSDTVAETLLENRRLTSYLKLDDKDALLDFLSITIQRETFLSPGSKDWELGQQIAEGTAAFVQLKAFTAIESEFDLKFETTWTEKMTGNLHAAEGVDGMIKWRHYAVGSIICKFLDFHMPNENWKVDLQSEKMSSLFQKVIPLIDQDDSVLKLRGQTIIASSEGDSARLEASKIIAQYALAIKTAKDQITTKAFQIKVNRPKLNCSGGGASEKTYYLAEGGTLILNYSGSLSCESEFQESFSNIPVLLSSDGANFFGVEDFRLWINLVEVAHRMKDGAHPFENLRIEGATFSVRSAKSGTLIIAGPLTSVQFVD